MIQLGKYNKLITTRQTDNGIYLRDLEDGEEVLLPNAYVPEEVEFEREMDVFVYLDSEERPVATTLKPKAVVGDFAYLQVKEISEYGAFLDWGLLKDLFVPFREQLHPLDIGEYYIVYVYLDEDTERLAASTRLNRYFQTDPITVEEGQEVDLLIGHETDLGVNVVINNEHRGLVYHNDIFKNIKAGDRTKGYIKLIRPDGKIDVSLRKSGFVLVDKSSQIILDKLKENDGYLALHDKSKPEEIQKALEMSKKTFKKAIGGLYKQKRIVIEDKGIRLAKPNEKSTTKKANRKPNKARK